MPPNLNQSLLPNAFNFIPLPKMMILPRNLHLFIELPQFYPSTVDHSIASKRQNCSFCLASLEQIQSPLSFDLFCQ
jgi:hypothetical protein